MVETRTEDGTGRGERRDTTSGFFQRYGLAFVMVASVVGAGSIFVASSAGIQYGYTLIWAFVGVALIGVMAQDMSARLEIFGEPLGAFMRRKFGERLAVAIGFVLSIGAFLWVIELTAATAKGIAVLTGGAIGWMPLAIAVTVLSILTGVLNYDGLERVMTAMLFVLFGAYLVVTGASAPSPVGIASGLVPAFPGPGALGLTASILGSTAIWSNFFLESNLVEEKDWTGAEDVPAMRRDLLLGYGIAAILIVLVLIVCAAVLRPAGYDQLGSFITPGLALAETIGQWAMVLFLVGAAAAAFNSIMPVVWSVVYLFENARGKDVDSADRSFKLLYTVGAAFGVLGPVISLTTGMSVVDMIVLFPAYSGIVSLPVTAVLLFWAINSEAVMGEHTNGTVSNAVNAVLVVLAFVLAALSAPDLLSSLGVLP
ncbi:NRAMP family divalent metal transporter [Halalkalicoccus jeotgali]|uniref:Mn2+ and Fe2+ transporter of the NRAMP family-like protein n=1 Tax=Halalkalicoccus jeotgali (strain DSM 18796 / CECT 7217 / JCM 14584 / KCTC 4019 / B3) TaxID=795797 RepID=D8J2P1_HALJB|nr:divalent metal cation transporter [Halalkalicoccus jeotgali]ADJ14998.1 Mn2+ and Fe2+ transporter of the NRAMP family- like protein [Halalkalicoccus jeotgali B3]ELY34986.1 Mn2+ and Fe2+ transporter-like protein [Halalkalicoccus jeotgali B3]